MRKPSELIVMVWAPDEDRTKSFAEKLKAPLFNIHFLQYKRPIVAPFKYILQALKTLQVLFKHRPRYVYITNPPAFAPLFVLIYCRLTGNEYIMDTHPPALYSRKWGWTVPLQRFLAKRAKMNVIDQERYASMMRDEWGAEAMVLENPLERNINYDSDAQPGTERFKIAVVNTFAVDEPLQPILDAARQLPDVEFHVTGDPERGNQEMIASAPENVVFTGYLRGKDYWNLVYTSRATMVLTTYPYSLLGGGMDSLLLDKPSILSDQPVLRDYFTQGTVFADNTADGLVEAINTVREQEQTLIQQVSELKTDKLERWKTDFQQLEALVQTPQPNSIVEQVS